MAAAALMMAHQVGGKSIRDALFLSAFGPDSLPVMVITAAAVSVVLGVFGSQLFSRFSPARAVPWGFVLSGVLQFAEWRIAAADPHAGAVVVYLHMVSFSAVLLSSFWLLLSEEMHPAEAKRRIGRIAAMGTAGGVTGGLLAAQWTGLTGGGEASLVAALGAIHVACGLFLLRTPARSAPARTPVEAWAPPRKVLRAAPHLQTLAVLVVLGTAAAAMVDFLYKRAATEALGRGAPLLEFFAYFNAGVAAVSFTLQTAVSRRALEKAGIGRTVGLLPASLAGGAALGLAAPLFPVLAAIRGLEATLRGSLFRAGYELMYTPIPPSEKRAAKTVIDVGCDRLGDALGGAICQAALALAGRHVAGSLLLVVGAAALVNSWVARRLDRYYVQVVERGLVDRAAGMMLSGAGEWTIDRDLLESRIVETVAVPAAPRPEARTAPAWMADDAPRRLSELRSGDPARVTQALEKLRPLDPVLAPAVIGLLAWDAVAAAAKVTLLSAATPIEGLLADRLAGGMYDFSIRRRIPGLLAAIGGRRAAEGLLHGLDDERFEVRYRCGRALDQLAGRQPELAPPADLVYAAIGRELSVDAAIWSGRRLLEHQTAAEPVPHLDDVLKERADRSLEHLFSLLSLVLPRPPLQAAFRALHTDDETLRALAFEYLEGVLPANLSGKLRAVLKSPPETRVRGAGEVVRDLLHSHASIELSIRRRALREPPPRPASGTPETEP
jgi:hypothetical protein